MRSEALAQDLPFLPLTEVVCDVQHSEPRASVGRRLFLGGAAATLSAASYRRVLGANDRVGVGFIGFGLIGKRHVLDFQSEPDVDLVAVAEVHRGRLDEAAAPDRRRRPQVTATSAGCSTTATSTRSSSRRPTTGTP